MEDERGKACSMSREMTNGYKNLVGKLEGKRPFVKPYINEDSIKINLKELLQCCGLESSSVQCWAVQNKVMNFWLTKWQATREGFCSIIK
jgi:hypothetical protein